MKAKKALIEVGHRALMHDLIFDGNIRKNLKPGEFIERYATDEEKEALKKLTSEDAQTMIRDNYRV